MVLEYDAVCSYINCINTLIILLDEKLSYLDDVCIVCFSIMNRESGCVLVHVATIFVNEDNEDDKPKNGLRR